MDGGVSAAGRADDDPGSLSGGRSDASGRGRADGGAVGPTGGARPAPGPRFDAHVPPGGYAWWYIDAFSHDGRYGLTIIAFVGSVFSPYYAWSRWRDPLDHCALNVALYRLDGGAGLWAMTERGRRALTRETHALGVGRSAVAWDGDALTITIDEHAAPIPARVRGTVRLTPAAVTDFTLALDPARRHLWRPIAPRAHVAVALTAPDLVWSGDGYLDSNVGSEPLQDAFRSWHWARVHRGDDVLLHYDTQRQDGGDTHALRVAGDRVEAVPAPSYAALAPTPIWRMPRRAPAGAAVKATLEDTPFYARSALTCDGCATMHESLSLDRLRQPVVRAMLPFRMPRIVR
jgi:carotenoid 1,2-hydratase